MSVFDRLEKAERLPDFDRLNLREPQNFGILYDYFAPRLWRHILIRTGTPDETDDILTKTFLKTWEYLRARRRIRNIRGFLYKTADRLVIDFYRARALASAHYADFSELEQTAVVMPALEEEIGIKHELARVLDAMKSLDEDDRRILTLRFVDGLDLGEIADIIGKSKGATAVEGHRALKRLRELL